jgi:hypothetical protein
MTEPQHPDAAEPRNPAVAFERRDVHIGGVLWFGVFLAGLVGASLIVVYGVYWHFKGERARAIRSGFPVAEATRKRLEQTDPAKLLPPAPRLERIVPVPEQQPAGRMLPSTLAFAPDGTNLLQSWGWTNEGHTAARIPVSEAISRLLAKRADVLKARPGARPMVVDRSDRPNSSNSGRGPVGGGEK